MFNKHVDLWIALDGCGIGLDVALMDLFGSCFGLAIHKVLNADF